MPEDLTPEQRALRARLAAHTLHASIDSRAHTAPARQAFLARFLDEVDPERVLPETERQRRAQQARKAYFSRLALRSSQARRRARLTFDEPAPAGGAWASKEAYTSPRRSGTGTGEQA